MGQLRHSLVLEPTAGTGRLRPHEIAQRDSHDPPFITIAETETMEFAIDPKSLTPMAGGQEHDHDSLAMNRRRLLKLGVASLVVASQTGRLLPAQSAPRSCAPSIPQDHSPSNGGSCPYPIPWLDKNGNHNQSPMPNVELSNIYHFKGKAGALQRFSRHGYGRQGQPPRLGHSHHRLQLHGGRVLGSA